MCKDRVSVSGWSAICEYFRTNLNIPCPLHYFSIQIILSLTHVKHTSINRLKFSETTLPQDGTNWTVHELQRLSKSSTQPLPELVAGPLAVPEGKPSRSPKVTCGTFWAGYNLSSPSSRFQKHVAHRRLTDRLNWEGNTLSVTFLERNLLHP